MTDPIGTAQERRALDNLRVAADVCELDENPTVVRQAVRIRAAMVSLQSRIAEVGRLETALRVAEGKLGLISATAWDGPAKRYGDTAREALLIVSAALSLQRRPT